MAEALDTLPPKMLSLSSLQPAQPLKLVAGELTAHVELAKERIRNAAFTGKGDAATVPQLYEK